MTRIPLRLLAAIYVPSTALLAALAIASIYLHIPIGVFTRDPTSVAGVHPFTGILSNLGILMWSTVAVTTGFSGIVIRNTQRREVSGFLISSSLVTLVLLLDDLFLFHEFLAGRYLGISQNVVHAFLGAVTAVYLITFRRVIVQTNYAMLVLALTFFAISVAIDVFFARWLSRFGGWHLLMEDGAKFLGLASWCGYYVPVSRQFLISKLSPSPNIGMEPSG